MEMKIMQIHEILESGLSGCEPFGTRNVGLSHGEAAYVLGGCGTGFCIKPALYIFNITF